MSYNTKTAFVAAHIHAADHIESSGRVSSTSVSFVQTTYRHKAAALKQISLSTHSAALLFMRSRQLFTIGYQPKNST